MKTFVFALVTYLLGVTIPLVSSQACPNQWVGYSSKCYRFVVNTKLAWSDARDFCQLHGGDLLKVDTVQERTWVIGRARSISASHKLPFQWWTGLNNREYLTAWEWADGSSIANNVINWGPGEPNNWRNNERCGDIWFNSRFNDESCTVAHTFICYRNRGDPVKCDADRGWQIMNSQCYKVYPYRSNWYSALRQCNHDGGSMVNIDSPILENTVHDLAVTAKQPLWLGLHSFQLQRNSNLASWVWSPNNTQMLVPYWQASKPPVLDRSLVNRSCVAISNLGSALKAWNAQSCYSSRAFVCQKPEGVCFPGWIGHRGNCYQFNPHFQLGFNEAARFCQSQGAELARIYFSSDQAFVNSYLAEMSDSGSGSFWIGLSDNNKDGGAFVWRNGQAPRSYKNWAAPGNKPNNTAGKQDCIYINTNDGHGKWRVTTSCQSAKSFVCTAAMGKSVTYPPSTPLPHYGCPSGWQLHAGTCFRVHTEKSDAFTARQTCQKISGADLAKIADADTQAFLNGVLPKSQSFYIGLNDRHATGVFCWNDETLTANYTNWRKGEPNDYHGRQENCVVLNQQWNDIVCTTKQAFICSMLANSPIIPPTPTIHTDWTVKCGTGWESNPLSDSCYLFSDEPLAWTDARLQCQVYGGDLVAIGSLGEQNYLAGRLIAMNSLAVWTGANDRRTEGGWNWVSGAAFSFLNWAPGSPGGAKGQGTDCVAMLTTTAMWDDISCDTRNGYICEKTGNIPTTRSPTTKAVSVPAGMVLGCNAFWLPFGDNCYYILNNSITWDQASTFCVQRHAHLASVGSAEEQNFLQANMPHSNVSFFGIWIGLNDKKVDNNFEWTDGSTVTYTNWNKHEPNNWMNRNEDCTLILMKTGYWNDEVCSIPMQGLVCKRPKSVVSATQSPWRQGCPQATVGYGPFCYRYVGGSPLAWSDANAWCNNTYSGNLATVNDRYLQAFLASMLARRSGFYWVGLSDKMTPGTYTWASGAKIDYTNWDTNHTGNERSTCVAMRASTPIGFWDNLGCSQLHNYVCEIRRQGYTTPPTPGTPWPNVPCPSGWTSYQGNCYQTFCNGTLSSWMEALGFCQGLGGDLPSLHSQDQAAFLLNLTQSCQSQNLWLGINDRDTEGGMKWSDGSPMDYSNWNPGEPNNWAGSEDCGSFSTKGEGWNDLNCYYTRGFVCALPRGSQLHTTPAPPTGLPYPQCGSDAPWILYNGSCYFRSPPSGANASLSWYDASSFCDSHQATLVSIHSPSETEFVIGSFPLSNTWTGLNILGRDAYSWSDGSPVDYSNWNTNEPNNYGGVENCVHLTNQGKWNDNLCQNRQQFVCKKPQGGAATHATPPPYPKGGCRNGFTPAPGGRNKCFYLGGGTSTTHRNFSSAWAYCRSFGPGYDLASIEDTFEMEFVLSMADGYSGNLWIGLADNRGNNQFYWQNGAPLLYTNWDDNMPNSANPDNPNKNIQNCVMLMLTRKGHEGRWRDVQCQRTMGFVCQAPQDPSAPLIVLSPGSCPSAVYRSFRNACYRLGTTTKSWFDANTDCRSDGGNLVSVSDVVESAFVVTMVANKAPFWIGLSDTKVPGLYGWSDGWPVQYAAWSSGEPQFSQGQGNGCVISDQNGSWNDTACSTPYSFICKLASGPPPPTPGSTSGECSSGDQIPRGDYCYWLGTGPGLSWPDSSYGCEKRGMKLASAHDDGEMGFLWSLAQQYVPTDPSSSTNIWIGMTRTYNGAYKWSDGTAVSYLHWQSGQPNTLGTRGELEECVEINQDTGLWDDISCFSKRGYICKVLKPHATSPPPFTFPAAILTPAQGVPPPTRYFIFGNRPTQGQATSAVPVATAPYNPPWPVIHSQRPFYTQTPYNPFQPQQTQYNPVVTKSPQTLQQTGNKGSHSRSSGMSGGAIAGVIIGVLGIVALAGLLVLYLRKAGRIKGLTGALGFDNALYKNGTENIPIEPVR